MRGGAPVLGGESDSMGASSDFWVCVWVAKELVELRIVVWCQVDEYRCGHIAIILQRYLSCLGGLGPPCRFAKIFTFGPWCSPFCGGSS